MNLRRRPIGLPVFCLTLPALVSAASEGPGQELEKLHIEGSVRKEYVVKLEMAPHKLYCQATTSVEYVQKDDIVRVSGEITNGDCAASSGEYTVKLRYRDESGEVRDQDIDESWAREDDQAIELRRDYEIGRNADLIRVSIRRMKCLCADAESDTTGEVENQSSIER